jgi:hypothetical protein
VIEHLHNFLEEDYGLLPQPDQPYPQVSTIYRYSNLTQVILSSMPIPIDQKLEEKEVREL